MRCVGCGHELIAGERFCQSCGRLVAANSSSSPAPESPSTAPSVTRGTPVSDIHAPAEGAPAAQVGKPTRWRELTWAALAVVLYALIADAAVETFLQGVANPVVDHRSGDRVPVALSRGLATCS